MQQASNPLALALKAARKPTLTAADALKTLTQVSEALQRPGSDTTLISEDPNTIPAVLGAIRRFPADSRVQDAAVFCIRLLACIGSDDVCTALMDMGAAELLYTVLKCGMPERVTHARVALRCCGLAPPPQDAPRVPIGPPTSTSASICIDSGPARMIQLSAASAIVESTSTSASDASIAEYQTVRVQAMPSFEVSMPNPSPTLINFQKSEHIPVRRFVVR